MANRRFRMTEVSAEGTPEKGEITLDFGLLDSQLELLEQLARARSDEVG